jgi:8-amino-7-oxononanoate synthase
MAMTIWLEMQLKLDELMAAEMLRRPAVIESAVGARISVGGRELVCMCSNDYLCLANDPAVKRAAVEAIGKWGVGAGASRLVCGTTSLHTELEGRLARFKGCEACLVTSTGWQANHVAIAAMVGGGDLILCDKLNHASIIDGAFASGARVRTYPHCDMGRLAEMLGRHRGAYRRCLIVTDSVFSMDGDVAPLAELVRLKNAHDTQLMIDEAHATGVLGEHGRGAAELAGVEGDVDVTVGTLSKAMGALGGFVCGRQTLIETIVNSGRAYIYTTALPPALCAAAMAAIDIVEKEPARRVKLLQLAKLLRLRIADCGLRIGEELRIADCPSTLLGALSASKGGLRIERNSGEHTPMRGDAPVTQIIPVVIGSAAEAVRVSKALMADGFMVPAIRPPTVPPNTSRLRISLCCGHTREDVEMLAEKVRLAIGKVAG